VDQRYAIPGLHLLSKNGAPGDVMTPEYYLQLMTMHGTIMVFFVLTTAPFAAFGNFLPAHSSRRGGHALPALQHDVVLGDVRRLPNSGARVLRGRGPHSRRLDAVRSPQRIRPVGGPGEGTGRGSMGASIAIFCIGQLLGSLNFITTTLDMRAKACP
jgi:cytochrome c oxidase subunit 1